MAHSLNASEARHVFAALDALHTGDADGYRWALWIGLGDAWHQFHTRLVTERAVAPERHGADIADAWRLTTRGERIRLKLSKHARTPSESASRKVGIGPGDTRVA